MKNYWQIKIGFLCIAILSFALSAQALNLQDVPALLSSQESQLKTISRLDCASRLKAVADTYQKFVVSPTEAQWLNQSTRRAQTFGRQVLSQGFKLRRQIQDRLSNIYSQSDLSESCSRAHREAIQAIRSLEDQIIERVALVPIVRSMPGRVSSVGRKTRQKMTNAWAYRDLEGKTYPKNKEFKGNEFAVGIPFYNQNALGLVNPSGQIGLDLIQSGDVLMSRGTSSVSAAIARVGRIEGNYSHAFMVYKPSPDEEGYKQCKKGCIVESLIETGVHILSDLKAQFKKYGASRITLMRFRGDKNLAHQAAKEIYLLARDHQDSKGKNICYDPNLDDQDDSCMYCSEVVRWAYRKVTDHQLTLPLHSMPLQGSAPDFVTLTEIKSSDYFFAPSDMEVDPRFETVAEWRDFTTTRSSRL